MGVEQMVSSDLPEYGFENWLPFTPTREADLLNRVPQKPGVYVIRSQEPYGSVRGVSDILYIGSAVNQKGSKVHS